MFDVGFFIYVVEHIPNQIFVFHERRIFYSEHIIFSSRTIFDLDQILYSIYSYSLRLYESIE